MPLRVLAIASYYKGNRFLEAVKADGAECSLLTVESALKEPWARHALADVFAVRDFHDRRALANAVAYLFRTRPFDRIVALDDFDIEVGAFLREHFRMTGTGHGDSESRLFRDKLAMREKAREIGVRIPDFAPLFNDAEVNAFLARVPGPWLVKPRSEASAAGIRKVHTPADVWKRIHEMGDDRSFGLIEQMVPGDLFHVDSLTRKGEVIFTEVNAYHRPLLDVYQGGGVYSTRTVPRGHPDVSALTKLNADLLRGFGLGQGASHTEFMKGHADGQFYFIETSARVGGANTADMVEAASGVNLWAEWARLEIDRTEGNYTLPPLKKRYAGVVLSLAKTETPDTSPFTDPEIVQRIDLKNHIGFVLASDSAERVQRLLNEYIERIAKDYQAVMPAADKVSH
jgi:hypothetical protein